MTDKYVLDENRNTVPVEDLMVWGQYMQEADRCVKVERLGDKRVSTVFLGLDHSFGNGPPLLFETMVFGGDSFADERCERYSTWKEAEDGHRRIVERLKAEGAKVHE